MIIIRLRGGLGNQMFQYAMGKRIASHFNTKLKIDLTSLLKKVEKKNVTNRDFQLHIFTIEEDFLLKPSTITILYQFKLKFLIQIIKATKLFLYRVKTIKERKFNVDERLVLNPKDNTLYSGYWQSEKYFMEAESVIRNDFQFKEVLSENAKLLLEEIKKTNSVCVHVRRGDYVGNSYFEPQSLDYFYRGESIILNNNDNIHFFVFSDDPEWCKLNFNFKSPFTIVDFKTSKIKFKEDLQLMSNCNHFIISASSFSWWAVWLRDNPDGVVVAPKKWYLNEDIDVSDMVSNKWIRT